MREIKFRAWIDRTMVYGVIPIESNQILKILVKNGVFPTDRWKAERIKEPVMQYTGLEDKNGKEIYEGDILRWNKTGYCAPVSYEGGWFVLNSEPIMCYVEEAINDDEFDTTKDCRNSEIIGNIHEHPSLLEQGK